MNQAVLEQIKQIKQLFGPLSPAGKVSAEGTSVCIPCLGAVCSLLSRLRIKTQGALFSSLLGHSQVHEGISASLLFPLLSYWRLQSFPLLCQF